MSIEILWENMSPKQIGDLREKLKKSEFEISSIGIIDVKGRQEIKDFPRPNRNYANIGFIRNLARKGICAGIANIEYETLEKYHKSFKIYVEQAKSRFIGYNLKREDN
jgi:hypothetical protein